MTGHTKAQLWHRFGVLRKGQRTWLTDYRPHLILDSGMDKVASTRWAPCFSGFLIGNAVSPTPVRRDSNLVTISASGTTATASGNFFEAGDVGRIIKWDDIDGTERYISAYNSPTDVTLSSAATVAATTAVIWYVNVSALDANVAQTRSFGVDTGDNDSSFSGNVLTMKRTMIGSALAGATTVTEIGFSNNQTNSDLFDRDVISGGFPLSAGDQPLAEVNLILTFDPSTPLAVGDVGTGCDTSGTLQYQGFNFGTSGTSGSYISSVGSNGSNVGDGTNQNAEPSLYTRLCIFTSDFTQSAFAPGTSLSPAGSFQLPIGQNILQAYSAGSFYRDTLHNLLVGDAIGTIYGLGFMNNAGNGCWGTLKFTTPFTKDGTQVLNLRTRKSWSRTLVN